MCNCIDLSQLSIDLTLLSIYSTPCGKISCFSAQIGLFYLYFS